MLFYNEVARAGLHQCGHSFLPDGGGEQYEGDIQPMLTNKRQYFVDAAGCAGVIGDNHVNGRLPQIPATGLRVSA